MNATTAISAGATAAIVKAMTETVVSEGVIMTYHNGMAVRVRKRAARHRRVA